MSHLATALERTPIFLYSQPPPGWAPVTCFPCVLFACWNVAFVRGVGESVSLLAVISGYMSVDSAHSQYLLCF